MKERSETDTVIDEIHRTRRDIAERFDGNLAAILEDARRRQAASGRAVWQKNTSNPTTLRNQQEDPNPNPNSGD